MDKLGDYFINIGTERSCFFVANSKHLMMILERYPLLYYAIEEGVVCAKRGYFAGGILAFAQLINLFNKATPPERHVVAHNILEAPPNEGSYKKIVEELKAIADAKNKEELRKYLNKEKYNTDLEARWRNLIKPPVVESDVE